MLDETTRCEAENLYGDLYRLNERGDVLSFFNEQGFAKLYELACMPVFVPGENTFYHYQLGSGLWQAQSSEEMHNRLSLFLHQCAIHFCAIAIEGKRKQPVLSSMLKYLKAMCARSNFFQHTEYGFIHCGNGVLELDDSGNWELKPFSPDYHSRNRCEILYSPDAACPRFLNELLLPLVPSDDVELIRQYIGQCLTGRNITQSILLLTGSGGSGKGTLANIVEALVGEGNYTQIRPEQITGRFECSFFRNKTLLTGKESNRSFFCAQGMQVLKSLVGADKLRAELKNSNQHEMIDGTYNVFIVGNTFPVLALESKNEESAWKRRLRWVKCKSAKPVNPIPAFDRKLIAEEGSGILRWALEGAKKVILSGSSSLECSVSQEARLDYLFHASKPLDFFLDTMVEKRQGTTITGDDLFKTFTKFALEMEWPTWTQRGFQKQMPDAMLRHFGTPLRRDVPRLRADGKTTNRSGFFHVAFKY